VTVLSTAAGRVRVLRLGQASVAVQPRYAAVCVALLAALPLVGLAALAVGAVPVGLDRVLGALVGSGTASDQLVVVELRLSRVVCGALVGLALGLAGAVFQSVTRNPLGSPDVIGFDTGAATGALVAMLVLGGGVVGTSLGAVAGGAVTAAAVSGLALRHGSDALRLVLVGIGVGGMLSAANSMLIVNAEIYDAQSAAVWLIGNLAGRGWSRAAMLAPVLVVLVPLALLLSRRLRIAELSDERASGLGLRPGRMRLAAVGVGVMLASTAVATAGPIAFIALTAPQVARRVTRASGPNLFAAGLTGALLLVISDFAAREAFQPRQLPVGVVTGVVGGGYLAWLLTREWRKGRG
jgi:iron complex transport system permease protein